jgi:outer membrane protein assembly factor BamB
MILSRCIFRRLQLFSLARNMTLNHSRLLCRLLITCIFTLALTPFVHADNWPYWRGPDKNGISRETGLPTTWSATKNVAWKLPLPGKGSSTPVIWGERIFMTAAENGDLILLCVNTGGKIEWKRKIATAVRSVIKKDEANEASASPSTDGKHVFAFVGSGDIACFDFAGNEIWKFNAQERYGKFDIQHGIHVTPLLYEDQLYLSLIHSNGHWVIALDKATGKDVWKIERKSDAVGESREAYASPCLWNNSGEINLVVLGADYTTGHRLKDGSEIWRLGDLNPKTKYSTALRIISSPVATDGMLVVPTARGGLIVALKQGAKGTIKAGSPFEQWRNLKGAPDVPSPLVHDGLVYLQGAIGVLSCVDAQTGKEYYQERLHAERYRASPVYADGKIYLTSREGNFSVLKAGSKLQILATNTLPDEFTASPAISNGRIYLRGFRALYAIGEEAK